VGHSQNLRANLLEWEEKDLKAGLPDTERELQWTGEYKYRKKNDK